MRLALTFPVAALLAVGLTACDTSTFSLFAKHDDAATVSSAGNDPIDKAFAEPPAAAPAAVPSSIDGVIARARTGDYLCAGKVVVNVSAAADNPREFIVKSKSFSHRMVPVVTASGVVRLEDAPNGIVWLQVRERAMLMNQTKGQRVAAECLHQ
ncbi:hypothetical protein [Lampropedia cohaerens]|uniref:hypothetical protein n=1 Tax=Lampropedia cohaerens TaxID=1610491 RepID=UPI000699F3CC|nr:hypothetical protein [Lampropedia cohaerens]